MRKNMRVLCVGLILLSLCVAAPVKADDPLPAPDSGGTEAGMPDLSLGDSSGSTGTTDGGLKEDLRLNEPPAEVAGSPQQTDDTFYLPPPMDVAPLPSAGAVTPNTSAVSVDREERYVTGKEYKPGFGIMLGQAYRNYEPEINYHPAASDNRLEPPFSGIRPTLAWNFSGRFYNYKNVAGLWAQVGMFSGIDKNYRLGIYTELHVGRRLQLIGGITKSQNYVWWPGNSSKAVTVKFSDYLPGLGAQYDWIVEPHYSVGVRGYIEKNAVIIQLALSLEPAPATRLTNLNYRESVW